MNHLLSVIIPIYNRSYCIEQTLDSLFTGTCLPRQLILVDNNSTDDSLERCRKWARAHESSDFCVWVISEPRQGAAIARNRGLQVCETPYVYFFDSDDLFDASAVNDIISSIQNSSQAPDMLFLSVLQEQDGQTKMRSFQTSTAPHLHILSSMLSTVSMVFRTEWLRRIGGWDESLSTWDDWELGVRALLHQPRIHWITSRSYHHIFVHSDSITGHNFTQTLDATLLSMRHVLQDITTIPSASARQRTLAFRALYFRARIMAGQLLREHNQKGATAYRLLSLECLPHPAKPLWMTGLLLETYTSKGGRGAWRIALALCH